MWLLVFIVGLVIILGLGAVAWKFHDRITNRHVAYAAMFLFGVLAAIGSTKAVAKIEDIKAEDSVNNPMNKFRGLSLGRERLRFKGRLTYF